MNNVGLMLVFAGMSFVATPSVAATLVFPVVSESSSVASGHFSDLVAVATKKSKRLAEEKKRKRSGNNFNFSYRELGIIPGHVPTPYGYRDCMGRWHLHDNGIIHCHGQLIRDY